MRIKRPLAPPFLNKMDESLLVNKPSVWSARAHLVLYYTLLFVAFMLLLGFAWPSDPLAQTQIYVWTTLASMAAFLGFVCWVIYLVRFNVFKRFGEMHAFDGLTTFLLYFVSVGVLVAAAFIPSMIESKKAHLSYTYNEIATDVNGINIGICKLEKDSMQLYWDRSTFILDRTVGYENDTPEAYINNGGQVYKIDSSSLAEKIRHADSLIKVNDSTYTIFVCPDYQAVHAWAADTYSSVKQLSSLELYHQVLEKYQQPDRLAEKEKLNQLLQKYRKASIPAPGYEVEYYNDESSMTRIKNRYNLFTVNDNMGNVLQKMIRWEDRYLPDYTRVFYYTTIVLVLLLFAFRHTTAKTFFLTLLVSVLLTILTSVLLATFPFSSMSFFLGLMMVYYLIFAFVSAGIGSDQSRKAYKGIALNLFLFCTPFIPLIVTAFTYELIHESRQNTGYVYTVEENAREKLHYTLAEIGGFLLLLAMVQPVFRKVYRKWYALPEE